MDNIKSLSRCLLGDIDTLSIKVVEEWPQPEKVASELLSLKFFYQNQLLKFRENDLFNIIQKYLDELQELGELIVEEKSNPDVVQEYLCYFLQSAARKIT